MNRGGLSGWVNSVPPTGETGLGAAVDEMVALALAKALFPDVESARTCQVIPPSGRLTVGTNRLFAVVVDTTGLGDPSE